jgi:CxxC-x17-CxxC domain-containing protein
MQPNDAVLTCRDCGSEFAFTDDERSDFAASGHFNPPSRCSTCRAARKTRQADSGRHVIGPRFRELHQTETAVTCSSCGATTVVPFAAQAGRSVYCSACLRRRRAERDA